MLWALINDGMIDERNGTKELPRTIKTFEYKNAWSGVKCCDHGEKSHVSDTSGRDTRFPEAFSDKIMFDIDYFTDEPVVQCDISVLKK